MVSFNIYLITGTISLAVQISVLFLLTYGYILKRRFKFRQHGVTMATAVITHLAAVFAIMIPAYVLAVVPDYIVRSPLDLISIVNLLHSILGSTALTLGVWLVAAWGFKKDFAGCFSRKRFMHLTLAIWVVALVLGIVNYALFYGAAWFS